MSGEDARLAEVREREHSATKGPWERRVGPREGVGIEQKAEYLRGTAADNGRPLQVLISASEDLACAYMVPAITGDGPRSEANAEFIAHAREDVPWLLGLVDTLTAEKEAAEAERDALAAKLARVEALVNAPGFTEAGAPVVAQDDLRAALSDEAHPAGSRKVPDIRDGLTSSCKADRDGDCGWVLCPQVRDGEPQSTGRHCPLDRSATDEQDGGDR